MKIKARHYQIAQIFCLGAFIYCMAIERGWQPCVGFLAGIAICQIFKETDQ